MQRRTFLKSAMLFLSIGGGTFLSQRKLFAETVSLGPMLAPWTGAHDGLPRFDLLKISDFKPALLQGMDLKRVEIKSLTDQTAPANFDNTIAALEDAGRPYGRTNRFFNIYTSTMNDKSMQSIESEMTPLLAKFDDEIIQNDPLFQRIKTVYEARKNSKLTDEQQRLVEVYYQTFTRQGAGLDDKKKARLREINEKLATLYTDFRHNQLADEEKYMLVLDSEKDLAGLSDSLKADAASQAETHGKKGKWIITNTRSSMEPFITFSSRRDLREKGWRLWTSRGDNNDVHDNKKIIGEILKLRSERAKILGFSTHAHWVLDDNMAKTPENAMNLMLKVWKATVARIHEEVADMQALADKEPEKIKIEPWDYRYYAEKVRLARYNIDQNEVKEYLQLDKIRDGMFWAAKQVYGIDMVKVDDVPVVQKDVTVYEVRRDGKQLGLWYFDPYARDGKNSGAWMDEYRTQERFRDPITPIVSNNANFVKGKPGEPVLISWDDATTMFHEFGHALHGLQSNVTYPSLAGTSVKRDFVEFPSQVNERWLMTPEVLSKFALHYKTGKAIPEALVEKLRKAKTFNEGFTTGEYLISAIYDMKIHLAATPDTTIQPDDFEKATMREIGCPAEIVMRHRPTAFGHIFAADSYSAGYYVYIWADTMSADATEAFKENGGMYDRKTCDRFRDTIFSVGNSVPPDVAFRNFRGRDVDTNALMRDRGFPVL
ncbi:MAG: M3 family metallopeptidase [Candidatus Obscuribacterales bacterium]|nr:M3 family metallopeptidase [Candidatus Obscuribacterales bacterium]